jgi:hypothetical protein
MEARSDCWGVLSEHPLEYAMLPDGDYNWSCSCGESGHSADYREHWVQIVITGVKETSPNGAEVTLTGATGHDQKVFDKCPTSYSRPRNSQESLDVGLTIAKKANSRARRKNLG